MTKCVFCKIVNGESSAQAVYEDDGAKAILSNEPITKGHVVIINKEHYVDLFDIPVNQAEHMMVVAKKLAPSVTKAMKTDSFILGMNNGPGAKPSIEHAHMHIIPRHVNDGLSKWPNIKISSEELEEVKKKIIKNL